MLSKEQCFIGKIRNSFLLWRLTVPWDPRNTVPFEGFGTFFHQGYLLFHEIQGTLFHLKDLEQSPNLKDGCSMRPKEQCSNLIE